MISNHLHTVATLLSAFLGAPALAQVEAAKLIAGDGAPIEYFGDAVSISGDRALVGARLDSQLGTNSGAAYTFERDETGAWNQTAKLTASDGAPDDRFGDAVSISGDRALVGVWGDDDAGLDSGSAYIFERNSTGAWIQTAKLTASDGASQDHFGESVSISGDRALVGAWVDGDLGPGSGSAYIFERDINEVWVQTAKLTASDGAAEAWFGQSVSISGDRAVIGARRDDEVALNSGAAYIFERDGTGAWNQSAKLTASDGASTDEFGFSASISGDRVLVGARQDDDLGTNSGSAYVFERQASGAWIQTAKLIPSDGVLFDEFGFSVAISADRAFVGAWRDDDLGDGSGSAYLFERDVTGAWMQTGKLTSNDGAFADAFGYSVAISADEALAGAPFDDDSGSFSGSAYVFEFPLLLGSPETIALSSGGTQTLQINAPPANAGLLYLVLGSASGTTPGVPLDSLVLPLNLDGYLLTVLEMPNSPPLLQNLGALNGLGDAVTLLTVPPGASPALAGITLHHAALLLSLAPAAIAVSAPVAVQLLP